MKLATLRTATGYRTIEVTGANKGRVLAETDAGTFLRDGLVGQGEEITFDPKDLAPVIPRPGKIICVGLNYARHILEMGRELPEFPTLFIKFPEALTGPYDDVHVRESDAGALDAEAELAVVIGKRAHRVSVEEATDHILGYSIINDYTQRDWQTRTLQFHQGKSYYRSAGFGPWIVTADEWQPGPRITATWGEEVFQDGTTDDLIFDCPTLVSFISQIYPLEPGDVIATGTPDGVGHARTPKRYIRDGETVTVAIEGIGAIANTTYIDSE